MNTFLPFTILVPKNSINLRRKALVRVDTIAGLQELNEETCKIVIERRDGTVEQYTVEETFDSVKDRLNEVCINDYATVPIEETD